MAVRIGASSRPNWTLIFAFALGIALCNSAYAENCRQEIRRNNILGNALFTAAFRTINGEMHSWRDFAESVTYGASAGYLFYKSRDLIGRGDESRGIATAYLAASITENTTQGLHPLAYLRYGVGPVEVKWATPFTHQREQRLRFGLNVVDAIGAVSAGLSGKAENFELRNGVLTADDRGMVEAEYSATTYNRTIITRPQYEWDQDLWHHELIHTTQYLQFSSFGTNNLRVLNMNQDNFGLSRSNSLSMDMRIEWFNMLVNQLNENQNYEDRWLEVEAARLAQNTSPLHDHNNDQCVAQLGIEFRF